MRYRTYNFSKSCEDLIVRKLIRTEPGAVSRTILIVEHYVDVREPLKLWLQMHGYRTIEAAHGDEAVEYIKKLPPDLVLMDAGLPDLNGIDATRQIRTMEKGKHIPIIVMTSHRDGLREKAKQAGCSQVIGLPLEYGSVLRLISKYF